MQDQIEELQIKFSFQEGTLHKLNEVVTDHQRELLLLKSEIRNLKLELQSMKDLCEVQEAQNDKVGRFYI